MGLEKSISVDLNYSVYEISPGNQNFRSSLPMVSRCICIICRPIHAQSLFSLDSQNTRSKQQNHQMLFKNTSITIGIYCMLQNKRQIRNQRPQTLPISYDRHTSRTTQGNQAKYTRMENIGNSLILKTYHASKQRV